MEGRPLRSVAVELFQHWLSGDHQPSPPAANRTQDNGAPTRFDKASWRSIIRPYINPGMSHDLDEMKEAISRGRAEEAVSKLKTTGD